MEAIIGLIVGFLVFLFGFSLGREADQDAITRGFFEHGGLIYRVTLGKVE
jgi:hypothetical protein